MQNIPAKSEEISSEDFLLWLQAAIPALPDGLPDLARTASRLHITSTTLVRWIEDPRLVPESAWQRIRQLAILRGHGHYLWPAATRAQLQRDQKLAVYAQTAVTSIEEGRDLTVWAGPSSQRSRLTPRHLFLVHYPHAHVYGLSIAEHPKSRDRLRRSGAILIEEHQHPTYWHAQLSKMTALVAMAKYRCTVPAQNILTGPTEVWTEPGGIVNIGEPNEQKPAP